MSQMSKLSQNVQMYSNTPEEYEILCHQVSTALNDGFCANQKVRQIITNWEIDQAEDMEVYP